MIKNKTKEKIFNKLLECPIGQGFENTDALWNFVEEFPRTALWMLEQQKVGKIKIELPLKYENKNIKQKGKAVQKSERRDDGLLLV